MSAELERDYECPRCGMRAVVVVVAERSKTLLQRRTEPSVSLSISDGMLAQDDATRTLGLVACPTCGKRPSTALLWSALRVVGYGLGTVIAGMLGMRGAFGLEMIPVLLLVGGAVGALVELRRWSAAARIQVVRQLAPPRVLPVPKAIATVAPAKAVAPPRASWQPVAIATVAPPQPAAIATVAPPRARAEAQPAARAPEPTAPASPLPPGDGPRFLK